MLSYRCPPLPPGFFQAVRTTPSLSYRRSSVGEWHCSGTSVLCVIRLLAGRSRDPSTLRTDRMWRVGLTSLDARANSAMTWTAIAAATLAALRLPTVDSDSNAPTYPLTMPCPSADQSQNTWTPGSSSSATSQSQCPPTARSRTRHPL